MTIEEQEDRMNQWRKDLLSQGYQIETIMCDYEGRQVPMECVWPPPDSEEEKKLIDAIARFVLKHYKEEVTIDSRSKVCRRKKPTNHQSNSKPISRK